mmetsp:Transcript_26632/g.42340  ORF Transcript_26632/g.42340 Transcript_26632/m.42340 type:complete len:102 (+) Transcript_26632:1669-1974(+)
MAYRSARTCREVCSALRRKIRNAQRGTFLWRQELDMQRLATIRTVAIVANKKILLHRGMCTAAICAITICVIRVSSLRCWVIEPTLRIYMCHVPTLMYLQN